MRTAWRVLNVVGLVFIAAAAAPPEKPVVESPVVQVKDLTPVRWSGDSWVADFRS